MIGGVVPFSPEDTQTWRLGDLAVDTLKELVAKDEPFFLRVSFHAPHVPCRVPASYFIDPEQITLPLPTEEELKNKPRFERENLHIYAGGLDLTKEQIGICRGTYYGMVSLVDAQVGRLVKCLKEAGLINNTIIAINSDQGFQLGEHGLWKKRVFYEQNVCVPFIMSCPGLLPSGKVIDEPVEMIDFLPTLMELSGIDVPNSVRGRSLMPLIRGEVKEWRPACFSEIDHSYSMYEELREGSGRRVMVRTKEWKLIYFMDERVADKDGALYNLKKDRDEKENLYNKGQYKDIIKQLEDLAEKWDKEN
jgi:arylsulfatase A-like enzyme